MKARRLLTRGPNPLEPPEAQPQTVPVGKRTALKVQEKVAPRRAGIRATCRSCSAATHAKSEGGEPVRERLPRSRLGGSDACRVGHGGARDQDHRRVRCRAPAEGLNGEGWATCPSPIPCPARPDGRPWSFGGRLETLETAYETGVSASSGCRRCPVARDLGGHGGRPEEQRTVAGWWREIGRV